MSDWFDLVAEYALATGEMPGEDGAACLTVTAPDLEGLEQVLPDGLETREGYMSWQRVKDWLVMHAGGQARVEFRREGTVAALKLTAPIDAVPGVRCFEWRAGRRLAARMYGAALAVGTGKACEHSPLLTVAG